MRTGIRPVRLGERAPSVPETRFKQPPGQKAIKEGATMIPRKSHNVGVRNHNPNVASPPAGSEGTVNPSATLPGGSPAPVTNASSGPVSVAVQAFATVLKPAVVDLDTVLSQETPSSPSNRAKVSSARRQAIPLLVEMLTKYPSLSATVTVDGINGAMTDASATDGLSRVLANIRSRVTKSTRIRLGNAWADAAEILAVARRRAVNDENIASDLAVVEAILAHGPIADTAPVAAAKAQRQANKATTRATKSQKVAETKAAKSAALLHGAGDVTIVPATPPTPPTNR